MSTDNQAILTKAIQKAIDGGFRCYATQFKRGIRQRVAAVLDDDVWGDNMYGLIFSHDFAKALWGDWDMVETGRVYNADGSLDGNNLITVFSGKNWQYHLQMMVVADDPIAYLGSTL